MSVGEMVMSVPRPSADVDVYGICQQLEAWAVHADDIGALRDNKAKLGAIDQYLAHTSKDGRNTIAATMRRLEIRIGDVVGAGRRGGDTRSSDHVDREEDGLSARERHELPGWWKS